MSTRFRCHCGAAFETLVMVSAHKELTGHNCVVCFACGLGFPGVPSLRAHHHTYRDRHRRPGHDPPSATPYRQKINLAAATKELKQLQLPSWRERMATAVDHAHSDKPGRAAQRFTHEMQHTFVGFGQGELSLARGTLLAVSQRVNTDPQGWSYVCSDYGQQGFVPTAYLESRVRTRAFASLPTSQSAVEMLCRTSWGSGHRARAVDGSCSGGGGGTGTGGNNGDGHVDDNLKTHSFKCLDGRGGDDDGTMDRLQPAAHGSSELELITGSSRWHHSTRRTARRAAASLPHMDLHRAAELNQHQHQHQHQHQQQHQQQRTLQRLSQDEEHYADLHTHERLLQRHSQEVARCGPCDPIKYAAMQDDTGSALISGPGGGGPVAFDGTLQAYACKSNDICLCVSTVGALTAPPHESGRCVCTASAHPCGCAPLSTGLRKGTSRRKRGAAASCLDLGFAETIEGRPSRLERAVSG